MLDHDQLRRGASNHLCNEPTRLLSGHCSLLRFILHNPYLHQDLDSMLLPAYIPFKGADLDILDPGNRCGVLQCGPHTGCRPGMHSAIDPLDRRARKMHTPSRTIYDSWVRIPHV